MGRGGVGRGGNTAHLHEAPRPRFVFSNTQVHGTAPEVPFRTPELRPVNCTSMVLPEGAKAALAMLGATLRACTSTTEVGMNTLHMQRVTTGGGGRRREEEGGGGRRREEEGGHNGRREEGGGRGGRGQGSTREVEGSARRRGVPRVRREVGAAGEREYARAHRAGDARAWGAPARDAQQLPAPSPLHATTDPQPHAGRFLGVASCPPFPHSRHT
jgi:hypothetical protein